MLRTELTRAELTVVLRTIFAHNRRTHVVYPQLVLLVLKRDTLS